VDVESCKKRQRIKLGAKRMIAPYGAGEAERMNERNAFPGNGLRSRCSRLQPNLLPKRDGFRPQSRLLFGFQMPMMDGCSLHYSGRF
jgi:hypothetical protein